VAGPNSQGFIENIQTYKTLNLNDLSIELDQLLSVLQPAASTEQDFEDIITVMKAKSAAGSEDSNQVVHLLKSTGDRLLSFTEKVISPVLTAIVKSEIGID